MKLGTGLFTCQRRPDDDRSFEAIYSEMCTLAETIEQAGLDSAWVSEHHFLHDGYLSGTMPALGAIAARTNTIEIGPCIAIAPLYEPVHLTEDAATIDLLANGRLTLGLAIGSNREEFDAMGIPIEERVDRLIDTTKILRNGWSPGSLDYTAEFHSIDPDTTITPKPSDPIPIMYGGAAKPAVRRAARVADAWCAPSSLSIQDIQKRVTDIKRVRDKEDISGDFDIYILQHGFVADSKQAAWEQMKDGYFYLQRRYAEMFGNESISSLSTTRKQELKDQAIFGTPEDVTNELLQYQEAIDKDIHFIYRTYYPGIGTQPMKRCINRLGDEVYPNL
ncbi:MAG: LLM class flavin-dependent oxidoreductase [Halobacteriaceae archaeon]